MLKVSIPKHCLSPDLKVHVKKGSSPKKIVLNETFFFFFKTCFEFYIYLYALGVDRESMGLVDYVDLGNRCAISCDYSSARYKDSKLRFGIPLTKLKLFLLRWKVSLKQKVANYLILVTSPL